jgi:DNA repair protein RadC
MELKIKQGETINRPGSAAQLFRDTLALESEIDRDKEHFWAIGLGNNNTVKYLELVSLGILDASLVHPREVFRFAILKGVKCIVVGHNHPSGNLEPSEADISIIRQLSAAGKILGIQVLDHVIVTETGETSFQERGLLK